MTRPLGVANGETRHRVLDELLHEADMDGVVVVSATEVARRLGVSPQDVLQHFSVLLGQGAISRTTAEVDRMDGRLSAFQLSESVMA